MGLRHTDPFAVQFAPHKSFPVAAELKPHILLFRGMADDRHSPHRNQIKACNAVASGH